MRYMELHPWDVPPAKAIAIQQELKGRLLIKKPQGDVRYIAGADVSSSKGSDRIFAGVVILEFPSLRVVEEKGVDGKTRFPYIPGLLAFREAPILLQAFEHVETEPDLILFDGQGLAHPRGLGIASHMGILLDRSSIGCAKSRLIGSYQEPGHERGASSSLYGKGGEVIGEVVRTKTDTNPVFISIGHRIDLKTAVEWVLECSRGYRIPDPTRLAHLFVNRLARGEDEPRLF